MEVMQWKIQKNIMNKIIIDTSVLLAIVDKKDKWNSMAEVIFDKLEEMNIEFYIFDCVANELISVIGKRLIEAKREREYPEVVKKSLEYIKLEKLFPVYDLVIPKYNEIIDTIIKSNGELNFHDSLIIIAAREYDMKYIASFDEDFDEVEGLVRIKSKNSLGVL